MDRVSWTGDLSFLGHSATNNLKGISRSSKMWLTNYLHALLIC